MSDVLPVVAQKGSYKVEVEAGKAYWWCVCGKSGWKWNYTHETRHSYDREQVTRTEPYLSLHAFISYEKWFVFSGDGLHRPEVGRVFAGRACCKASKPDLYWAQ